MAEAAVKELERSKTEQLSLFENYPVEYLKTSLQAGGILAGVELQPYQDIQVLVQARVAQVRFNTSEDGASIVTREHVLKPRESDIVEVTWLDDEHGTITRRNPLKAREDLG